MTFKDEAAKQEFEQQIDRNVLLAKKFKPKKVKAKLSLIKAQLAFSELSPESYTLFQDSLYGWDKYCSNISNYIVPGEHSTVFDEENNITQLGDIMKKLLLLE